MRPEWFRCDKCLWFQPLNGNWCYFDPDPIETIPQSYCSKWVCKDCQGVWDDEDNHSDCVHVEVELED